MSQHNYFALTVKAQMEKDPSVFTFDVHKLEENAKKMRAERDANTPPPSQADLRKEYNRLRQELYNLQQTAKNAETFCNNKAGNVRLLEQRINDLLKQKKQAVAENNLGQERMLEHQIQNLETELVDAQADFAKAKVYSGRTARALKSFEGHGRIAELKALLDGEGLPVAKTNK